MQIKPKASTFEKGDIVKSKLWGEDVRAIFIEYRPSQECDCIVNRDDIPNYDYPTFSWELEKLNANKT